MAIRIKPTSPLFMAKVRANQEKAEEASYSNLPTLPPSPLSGSTFSTPPDSSPSSAFSSSNPLRFQRSGSVVEMGPNGFRNHYGSSPGGLTRIERVGSKEEMGEGGSSPRLGRLSPIGRLERSKSVVEMGTPLPLIRRDSRVYNSPDHKAEEEVLLFDNNGGLDRSEFIKTWKGLEAGVVMEVGHVTETKDDLRARLARGNVVFIAGRDLAPTETEWFFSARTNQVYACIRVVFTASSVTLEIRMKAPSKIVRAAYLRAASLLKPLPLSELPWKRDYVLKSLLGRGEYSLVYLCVEIATDRVLVLKDIDKSNENFDASVFGEKLVALKCLSHPNILTPIRTYDSPSHYYIVMECVDGGDMYEQLAVHGRFCEADAAVIMTQLLKGLEYIHSRGVVHRDIKLENLLVGGGVVKIGDFNLCAMLNGPEPVTQPCGTPGYSAPEVTRVELQGDGGYGAKVDLFSAGAVLYCLLSGMSPFDAPTDADSLARSEEGDYTMVAPVWTTVSDEAKDLIDSLLKVDARERLDATQALSHPWFSSPWVQREEGDGSLPWTASPQIDVQSALNSSGILSMTPPSYPGPSPARDVSLYSC